MKDLIAIFVSRVTANQLSFRPLVFSNHGYDLAAEVLEFCSDGQLFSVFDGHGGTSAARFASSGVMNAFTAAKQARLCCVDERWHAPLKVYLASTLPSPTM